MSTSRAAFNYSAPHRARLLLGNNTLLTYKCHWRDCINWCLRTEELILVARSEICQIPFWDCESGPLVRSAYSLHNPLFQSRAIRETKHILRILAWAKWFHNWEDLFTLIHIIIKFIFLQSCKIIHTLLKRIFNIHKGLSMSLNVFVRTAFDRKLFYRISKI